MKIDLKPIISGQVNAIPVDCEIEIIPEAAPDDVVFTGPAAVKGEISGSDKYMSLKAEVSAPYRTRCARCLKDIEREFVSEIDKPVARAGTLEDEDTDDYIIAENSELLLDLPVLDCVVLEFPMRVLCKEDCRGLCPKCGKDLNEGDCGCDLREPDPRLAVLAQLLDKSGGEENK